MRAASFRNIGTRGGQSPARHHQPMLLEAVLSGEIDPAASST